MARKKKRGGGPTPFRKGKGQIIQSRKKKEKLILSMEKRRSSFQGKGEKEFFGTGEN